jgi:hypothetical protein
LLADVAKVLPVAIATRGRDRENALVDALRLTSVDAVGSGIQLRLGNLRHRRVQPPLMMGVPAEDLARESTLGVTTIRRAELAEGETSMTTANDSAVRRTLEAADVEFIDGDGGGPGVRLRQGKRPSRIRAVAPNKAQNHLERGSLGPRPT